MGSSRYFDLAETVDVSRGLKPGDQSGVMEQAIEGDFEHGVYFYQNT